MGRSDQDGSCRQDNIDFNEEAAVEFFDPPPYSDKHAINVRDVFKFTFEFDQGSKRYPAPYKWQVYVRCDDWNNRCKSNSGRKAYAGNYLLDKDFPKVIHEPDTAEEHLKSSPASTFAPLVYDNKDMEITEKCKLEYYHSNIEYIVLHEIMHANVITFSKNGNRHIFDDMKFKIKSIYKYISTYGPAYTELYSRVEETYDGGWVTKNADNFALYALSKAVQKALGNNYPYLPRPYAGPEIDDGPNGRKMRPPHPADASDNYNKLTWSKHSLLGYFIEDFSTTRTTGDDVNTCPAAIEVSQLIDDWKYPKEYLEKRANWLEEIKGHASKRPIVREDPSIPGDSSLRCNFDPTFMPPVDAIDTTFAKQKIIEACKLFDAISLDETKQPAVQMPYEGAGVDMHTYAAWYTGDTPCVSRRSGQISQQHCVEAFNQMINSCPNNGIDSETYGGAKVDGCIAYGFDVERTSGIGLSKA